MFTQNKATSFLFVALTVLATAALQGCGSNYSRSAAMNSGSSAGKTAVNTPAASAKTYKYNMDATMRAHLSNQSHKGMVRCHNHLQSMGKRMYHCHYHTQDR